MDLKTVKYLRKDFDIFRQNPYSSFYHPHFLIELKNNINNFYINFQMSTKPYLGFEELAKTDLNMLKNKIQYISPCIRVYETNMVEFLENEYPKACEFINKNEKNINDYVFKNLKEYTHNFEIYKQ
jgi:hypothetical protein